MLVFFRREAIFHFVLAALRFILRRLTSITIQEEEEEEEEEEET